MNRFRLTLAIGALALTGTVVGTTAPVHAGDDPAAGKQVLDALCIEDRGSPVFTPYAIGRCQDARATDGFVVERLVCDGLLHGTFTSNPSVGRPNRTNWACIPGATSD